MPILAGIPRPATRILTTSTSQTSVPASISPIKTLLHRSESPGIRGTIGKTVIRGGIGLFYENSIWNNIEFDRPAAPGEWIVPSQSDGLLQTARAASLPCPTAPFKIGLESAVSPSASRHPRSWRISNNIRPPRFPLDRPAIRPISQHTCGRARCHGHRPAYSEIRQSSFRADELRHSARDSQGNGRSRRITFATSRPTLCWPSTPTTSAMPASSIRARPRPPSRLPLTI